MENTTIFGLSLILTVIQFIGPSYVQGYSFQSNQVSDNFDKDDLPDLGPVIGRHENTCPLQDDDVEQKEIENGTDLNCPYSFVQNSEVYKVVVDYMKNVTLSVINEHSTPENNNYLKILNAVGALADNTMCKNSTIYYDLIYRSTVILSLNKYRMSAKNVATKVLQQIQRALWKVLNIQSFIEKMNRTRCVSTMLNCYQFIYNNISRSRCLRSEAQILSMYGDLAVFYGAYHDTFLHVIANGNVFSYLMNSSVHLRPLVQKIVATRRQAGVDVPPC